ncbi:polymorphic toxin type 35 domain-containing protein [Aneurinibacillus thermoaerophilus]|uniref:Bacterial toxin 35 domain-containing protein n=5 Tax=Aneurinibacillus thermoaerophilus TaxID=143495 RepID=A0ABX8YAS3_ANETH|nr:polymorphic toxin type 35 domain-containing protein [Aneurinibacillus thermoaerophilus]QYY42506.1 hypothetical protein K3F53_16960 [Aneurinibacillus thermoaerophilus]
MFGSLKNIYDMYRLGKSVVNSKSFQKSLNRAEKEYQKRRKKQEEKLKRTKAGRRQLKEIKAYEKATKQLWKGFTQSFQTLGKVCTSARKLATNLLPIEQIYKLKKIMKAEVIKKQNSAIKKLQKPKPIQKPKSVSPSSPPKCSMMDDLVVGLKKFGREFKPAFSHGAKELVTLSNYKPLTRELVGKENFDALTDNKWTMDDVKAAGGALENLFLGRLKIVKNINKTVKITKRLDKAKQPLQPPKPKQSTGNATKGTGKVKLLPSSKVHDAIGKLNSNQIKHIINGSKKSNHQWEKLVPDKNWGKIKEIIIDVMHNGADIPYKSVSSRVKMVNGQLVQVTYKKLPDGTIRISDAWVK